MIILQMYPWIIAIGSGIDLNDGGDADGRQEFDIID